VVAQPCEHDDPEIEALAQRRDRVLELERILPAPVDRRRHGRCDGLQLPDLRIDEARLELGHDCEVDDGERPCDDAEEDEAHLHAEAEARLSTHQPSRKR
jgi:hypothetical protein